MPLSEKDWASCDDPLALLEQVLPTLPRRKLLLFAVACCRRLGGGLRRPEDVRMLDVAEQFADGAVDGIPFIENVNLVSVLHSGGNNQLKGRNHPDRSALAAVPVLVAAVGDSISVTRLGLGAAEFASFGAALNELQNQLAHLHQQGKTMSAFDDARRRERLYEAGVVRDLVGNPFRPATLDPAWLTDQTVAALLPGLVEDRAFDPLPVLADALEDAGCTERTLLEHLRGRGPHVRGCWALDLLTGRT